MSLLILIVTLWLQTTFNTCEITNEDLQTITTEGEYQFTLTSDSLFVTIDDIQTSYLIDSYKRNTSITEVHVKDVVYYFFIKEKDIKRVIVKENNLKKEYFNN